MPDASPPKYGKYGPDLNRHRAQLLAWLDSPYVSGPTREALLARLDQRFERTFLDQAHFQRLSELAALLVPHDPALLDLAGAVDDRLARGETDGWRYADAPPDGEALVQLLDTLPPNLDQLAEAEQARAIQSLQVQFPRPFEDLLAELTGYYYSHPLAQLDIGCLGFADLPNWQHLGLNDPDPREQGLGLSEGGQP